MLHNVGFPCDIGVAAIFDPCHTCAITAAAAAGSSSAATAGVKKDAVPSLGAAAVPLGRPDCLLDWAAPPVRQLQR